MAPVSHAGHPAGHDQVRAGIQEAPGEARRQAADVLGIEHVDGAALRPGTRGEVVQVRPGRGDDGRAGMIEQPVGDDAGLARPLRGEDQRLVLTAGEDPAEVLRPADPDRVGRGGGEQPGPESHPRAHPAAVVQRGQAPPPQPQLGQRGVPGAGTQPQPGTPPQRPGPAPGLRAAAERVPVEQEPGGDDHEQPPGRCTGDGRRTRPGPGRGRSGTGSGRRRRRS